MRIFATERTRFQIDHHNAPMIANTQRIAWMNRAITTVNRSIFHISQSLNQVGNSYPASSANNAINSTPTAKIITTTMIANTSEMMGIIAIYSTLNILPQNGQYFTSFHTVFC